MKGILKFGDEVLRWEMVNEEMEKGKEEEEEE